jgi:hypothetical protein
VPTITSLAHALDCIVSLPFVGVRRYPTGHAFRNRYGQRYELWFCKHLCLRPETRPPLAELERMERADAALKQLQQ